MKSCVRDVMAARVVAVRKTAPFKEMIIRMRKSGIGALPVIDDEGRVIGVVSEADLLNKEADLATGQGPLASVLHFGDHEKAAGVTAAELMTSPPLTVGPETPLAEAARLMRDHQVKRLPVINPTGHLVGIVSRGDVLGIFTRPDAAIRREAAEEMIAESLMMDSRGLGVAVHDGIVTLTGRPETDQAGRDLVEAVRHIDGVIAVRDQLSYAGTPR
jgi:CBS domain-containing protein